MNNIMLDLETLGVSSNAVILSIGAVAFDEKSLGKEFEIHISPNDCVRYGMVVEPDTALWWMDQSDEARRAMTTAKRVPLIGALSNFVDAFEWEGVRVWCNGASFDFPIIENAFRILGVQTPWRFWNTMDYRTLKNLVPRKVYEQGRVDPKIAHSALEDAKAQALNTMRLLKWINSHA